MVCYWNTIHKIAFDSNGGLYREWGMGVVVVVVVVGGGGGGGVGGGGGGWGGGGLGGGGGWGGLTHSLLCTE